jgi:hypothetical protein
VIARVGYELVSLQFGIGRPEITLSGVTAVARIEKIFVGSHELRKLLFRSVVIYAEIIVAFDSVRKAAIYATRTEFLLQKWLVRSIGT